MAESRTADLEAQLLQGARGVQNNTENMLERLSKMFKSTDLVTIKNPFTTPFGWVYTDPGETTVEQPDTVTRRVNFGDPKARTLDAGEQRTIPGWEAYIALERMWKMYAQTDPSQVAIVLTSKLEMDSFLSSAFVGVFDPNSVNENKTPGFDAPAPTAPVAPAAAVSNTPLPQPQVPSAPIEHSPVVPPTSDPNLGFDDNDGDDDPTPPVVPPLNDGNDSGNEGNDQQGSPQLPPELQ